MALNENENIQATSAQCAVSDEVLKAIGKKVKTKWTRLIKLASMISAVHMFTKKKSTEYLKELHLSRLWDFCHARPAFVTYYTNRNGYHNHYNGWADIVENESVSITKEFSVVLNNIYLVILSSQKMVCSTSSHQKLVFTVMQMQPTLPWTWTTI